MRSPTAIDRRTKRPADRQRAAAGALLAASASSHAVATICIAC